MADLLALSSQYIDNNEYPGQRNINRTSAELSEIADGVAMMEAFSHVVVLRTDAGLVLFDTSMDAFAAPLLASLRGYSDDPVHTIIYTHGHIDHVGGTQAFVEETIGRGAPRPRVIGHENVAPRFARYEATNGYNRIINERQFGGALERFGPPEWVRVDTSFRDRLQTRVGSLTMDLRHHRGETDDHLWAWIPEHRAVAVGDFLTWVFPNAGNPQKVQRYPAEWAQALREMAALEPELLLPAHGLPIGGRDRIRRVLDDIATALETLLDGALALMNQGATLDEIVSTVRVPEHLMGRPFLQPVYDEPEFVLRNIWRLYGGWYGGNPAYLKPAPESALAGEIASLTGGASKLAARGRELAETGELRLACHLVELAVQAAPDDRGCHEIRAEVYRLRRKQERSLMARGVFAAAARSSDEAGS